MEVGADVGFAFDADADRCFFFNEKGFSKSYTSRFDGEWVLIYSEETENRAASLKREKQLKSFQGRQFIKKYIPR